jgi:hypothetical protein
LRGIGPASLINFFFFPRGIIFWVGVQRRCCFYFF